MEIVKKLDMLEVDIMSTVNNVSDIERYHEEFGFDYICQDGLIKSVAYRPEV